MKTPFLSRCATFAAASLIAIHAHAQYGGYSGYSGSGGSSGYMLTYPSGPLSTLYASGYIRVQAPLERAGHYFTLNWQTTADLNGPVSSATAYYYTGLATTGPVTSANPAAGQLQSLLVAIPTPPPTYVSTPVTYTSGGNTYTSYTYTTVPFSAVRWWLTDSTAGQESPKHNGTPNALSSVLGDTWTQPNGVPSRYFVIPVARLSHSLGLCESGGWTPVSTGYYTFATYGNGTSGATVPLGWFVGSATGSTTAYLGDLNTGESTAAGATDVRALNAWSPDPAYSFYPMFDTHVTLHAREAGHRFAVHCKAANAPELTRVFGAVAGTGGARLDFSVGKNLPFWITREADGGQPVAPVGASVNGSSWVATTSGATFSAVSPNPNLFPPAPNRPFGVLVRVNAIERAGHSFSVRTGDGYSTTYDGGPASHVDPVTGAVIDPYTSGSSITESNSQPVTVPLPVHTFTAWVDSRFSVTLRDEITGEELGPNPIGSSIDWLVPWVATNTSAPRGPTITLTLPFTRYSGLATRFARPDVADSLTGLPYTVLGLDTTPGPPNPTAFSSYTAFGSFPITSYETDIFSVTLTNPAPNVPGSFPLVDLESGDPVPVTVSAGANDLRTWFAPPVPVQLQISSSRWGHVLRLCHPNGEAYPITREYMAGSVSVGPGGTVYPQTYFYFEAHALARAEMPWYIEDRSTDPMEVIMTTGSDLGPTPDELIGWFSVPTPQGLTGTLSAGQRRAEIVWSAGDAPLEGAFKIERRLADDTAWTPVAGSPFAAYQNLADGTFWRKEDGLYHFKDPIPDSTVGQARSYRVRYAYGGEDSAYSNVISLTGWQDTDLDGLPDAWELANFGTLSFNASGAPGDPVGDADGDGVSNIAEFLGHTNPNALSASAPGSTLIVYTPLQ